MNVILIKLGALGDVLRTTCLIPSIHEQWPGAKITWLTRQNAIPLLERNPRIDRVLTIESLGTKNLPEAAGGWDMLINLDEEPEATTLASDIRATKKFGVGRDKRGRIVALAPESTLLARLPTDDRLKFRDNQMPFQALVHEAIGLKWPGEKPNRHYDYVPPRDIDARKKRLLPEGGGRHIGVFIGAAERFANKFWSEQKIIDFCREFQLARATPTSVFQPFELLLFGGIAEKNRIERLRQNPATSTCMFAGVDTLDDLAALICACDIVIVGDTLALHLAGAMSIPSIALFGPTSWTELSVHGRKIVSSYSCAPCYLQRCDILPSCMDVIHPRRVLEQVQLLIQQ